MLKRSKRNLYLEATFHFLLTPPYLPKTNHLPLKFLRKLSRPLNLSRGDRTTLARRAHGNGLESGRGSGSAADCELLTVGAADHGAGGGAGAASS